jgi:hypothetical protein
VVAPEQIILAVEVTTVANDVHQFTPCSTTPEPMSILNPPEPTPAFRRSLRRHRELIRKSK